VLRRAKSEVNEDVGRIRKRQRKQLVTRSVRSGGEGNKPSYRLPFIAVSYPYSTVEIVIIGRSVGEEEQARDGSRRRCLYQGGSRVHH